MPNSHPLRRHGRHLIAAALLLGTGMTAVAAPPSDNDTIALQAPATTDGFVPRDPAGLDLGRTALVKPLEVSRVTSGFAIRRHPIKKTHHHHAGVDFAAHLGAPVRTVDDGVVEFAGIQAGYGNVIYIKHGRRGLTTVYAHLDRIDVRKGQHVQLGDTIGTVGQTGLATGPHLHFEVREGGRPIDPMTLAYDAETIPRTSVPQAQLVAQDTSATSPRCVDLLQKASLETLDAAEINLLRQGCVR